MRLITNKLLLVSFLLPLLLYPDSFKFNTLNNHGAIGLINTPTARFLDESSYALTFYQGEPDSKVTMTLMPYEWFEASLFYTKIDGKSYPGYDQDYIDKGFNLKLRLKKEGTYPSLAIGLNDFAGTGIYSSEYIVSSYGYKNFDFHIGIGWGILGHGKLNFSNPLISLNNSFQSRNSYTGVGGDLKIENYFSGKNSAVFGGISAKFASNILFKAEYDSTYMPPETGARAFDSNFNFGLEFLTNNYDLTLSYERGDYFGLKISHKNLGSRYKKNIYISDREDRRYNGLNKLRYLLSLNQIGTNQISKNDSQTHITVQEFSYSSLKKLENNIAKAIEESGIDSEEIIISYKTAGLKAAGLYGDIQDNERLYVRENERVLRSNYGLTVRPFIAARESFIKTAVLFEANYQYIFSDNIFWSSNLKYSVIDNFDDLYIPPKDEYPYQVRSDIKKYLNQFSNRVIIGRSQIDFFKTLQRNNHFQFTAGILEEMFSGYGFEYLWLNPKMPFSFGIESHKVFKRDYQMRLGLKDYSNTTSHINLFYENDYIFPFTLKLSFGEYLAGDKGFTFDVSRNFNNGVRMGAFFTRTDITKRAFGEGSFDKGIYFSIPLFGNEILNYS